MRIQTGLGLVIACVGVAISTLAAAGEANILWRPQPASGSPKFIIDYDTNAVVDKSVYFGVGTDVGLVGDINGSGSFDLVLYRNGTWYVDTNRDGSADLTYYFGATGDIPLLSDFTNDGTDDLVLFRNGIWYVSASPSNGTVTAMYALGMANDKPVIGDVNGDGSVDIAVYRNGTWYVSTDKVNVNITFSFGGVPGDIPLFLDWNNDGRADACIYRNGIWYINLNKGGGTPLDGHADVTFGYGGAAGDVPLIGKSRYFGYYAASPTPAMEYGAHSNLTWEPWWSFATRGVAAKSATIYSAVVDITDLVFCRSNDGANCNGAYPNKWIYRG